MNTHATSDALNQAETVEEHIIRRAQHSHEKLPLLEVIFDRYALALAPALKSYTAAGADVELRSFEYMNCAQALESLPSPGFLVVTDAEGWQGPVLTSVQPELLFAALEITLGGRTSRSKAWTPRSFTAIEKRLGTKLCEVMLRQLTEAMEQFAEVAFAVSHVETTPQSMALAPPASPCARITLDVALEGRGGELVFVLPYSAFEEVRPVFAQTFLGGRLGGDTGWRDVMRDRLQDTNVTLSAVLTELRVPMSDMLGWRPGETLDLGIDAEHPATVGCGGLPMFRGAVGRRKNGSVALKVTEELNGNGADDDGDTD
ncbi:flagellar motor switch protein FliM [Tranquillimonas alkanivorans]|uniref:Flagellar motor switch protein FliM n=1 Tax=Tranquillimonas alkanivorans TaxID=441119 RepID=A0A1I5S3L4_9RHOB|nr:FliM/FliN family flagellar motor switch protein [Tranquillimonas alkanivorans]SFP65348.1 flagellar motor switch protein FliM [Tranquillimonas alkanivorans]